MKRTFQVIRGGKWNDVQGIEENRTARTRYTDQKMFQEKCREALGLLQGEAPVWDQNVQINRMLSV